MSRQPRSESVAEICQRWQARYARKGYGRPLGKPGAGATKRRGRR
jgi:hypothetical protein